MHGNENNYDKQCNGGKGREMKQKIRNEGYRRRHKGEREEGAESKRSEIKILKHLQSGMLLSNI